MSFFSLPPLCLLSQLYNSYRNHVSSIPPPLPQTLRFCAVIVVEGNRGNVDVTRFDDALPYTEGATSYITAAWDEDAIYRIGVPPRIFVGNDVVYRASFEGLETAFPNVPLRANTFYSFFTRYDIASDVGPEVSCMCMFVMLP